MVILLSFNKEGNWNWISQGATERERERGREREWLIDCVCVCPCTSVHMRTNSIFSCRSLHSLVHAAMRFGFLFRMEQMSQSGLFYFWERKHKPPDVCEIRLKQSTSSRALNLLDTIALFVILSVGLFSSLFTLAVEVLIHRCTRNQVKDLQEQNYGNNARGKRKQGIDCAELTILGYMISLCFKPILSKDKRVWLMRIQL